MFGKFLNKGQLIFDKTASWYDALYSFRDYKQESIEIHSIISQALPDAKTVLDVGCGTAEHVKHLVQWYEIDGIDINNEFIRIAKAKIDKGSFYKADMVDFNLRKKYDVVLCLFSSIGYVKLLENVNRTLCCFRNHLNDNGCIIIEPWFTRETWNPSGKVYMLTGENENGKICRMNISKTENDLSVLEFNYLIGTSDGIEYVKERHELGLFSKEDMMNAFLKTGLEVDYNDHGPANRGLYIGRQQKNK